MRARIMQTKKTILVYGLTVEQQNKLQELAKAEGILCKAVTDSQTTLTVAQLLSTEDAVGSESAPLEGKFAILDGFGNKEREGTALINQVDPDVLKAVRTPYNGGWKFKDLCVELQKEHVAMHKDNG